MLDSQAQEFQPIDKREAATIRAIGQKLREARGLMGVKFSQLDAAKLIGITRDELASYENTSDVQTIPLWVIKRLAEVYDISIDWLFGLVDDDWELCPENRRNRDFLASIEKTFIDEQAKVMVILGKQDRAIAAMAETVAKLPVAVKSVDDAFMTYWQRNPEFENMPAGASLLNAVDAARNVAAECTCRMVRFKAMHREALKQFDPDYVRRSPHEPPAKQTKSKRQTDA